MAISRMRTGSLTVNRDRRRILGSSTYRTRLGGGLALALVLGGVVACSPDEGGDDPGQGDSSPSSAAEDPSPSGSRTPKAAPSDAPGPATAEPNFTPPPPSPSPSETPPPPEGLTSPGLVPKDVGELGGVGPEDSDPSQWQLSHKVLAIEWDPTCTASPGLKPTQGAFLAVKMELTQFPERSMTTVELGHQNWSPVGPDGMAAVGSPATALNCLPASDRLPATVEWDSDPVTGWIVLDVPTDTARLSLTGWGDPNNGWIWDVPQR